MTYSPWGYLSPSHGDIVNVQSRKKMEAVAAVDRRSSHHQQQETYSDFGGGGGGLSSSNNKVNRKTAPPPPKSKRALPNFGILPSHLLPSRPQSSCSVSRIQEFDPKQWNKKKTKDSAIHHQRQPASASATPRAPAAAPGHAINNRRGSLPSNAKLKSTRSSSTRPQTPSNNNHNVVQLMDGKRDAEISKVGLMVSSMRLYQRPQNAAAGRGGRLGKAAAAASAAGGKSSSVPASPVPPSPLRTSRPVISTSVRLRTSVQQQQQQQPLSPSQWRLDNASEEQQFFFPASTVQVAPVPSVSGGSGTAALPYDPDEEEELEWITGASEIDQKFCLTGIKPPKVQVMPTTTASSAL